MFILVNETKPVEEVTTKQADPIESVSIEPIKSVEVAKGDGELVEATTEKSDDLKKLISTDMLNKTTTTVTVNVTQTKVTVDEGNKDNEHEQNVGQVVSTVASIAEAAIVAATTVEKNTQQQQQSSEINELPTTSVDDVEMVEANDDVEMKDAPAAAAAVEEPQTTTTTSNNIETVSKPIEPDSVNEIPLSTNENNEAEQKIDDVEKNISNLFNGDDNTVSTNSKTFIDSSKSENQSDVSGSNQLKNGSDNSNANKNASTVDTDNNDLVSILAGNDKVDAISSSRKEQDSIVEAASSTERASETKNLKGISTPSSSTTTATVYNSTPIQKQFEISSENVSTISESAIDSEHILGDKSTRQEIISSHSSTINEKLSDLSSSSAAITGLKIGNIDLDFDFIFNKFFFFFFWVLSCRKRNGTIIFG